MVSAVWRRFGVHVFEGKLTLGDMDKIDELGSAWRKKNPATTVELVIIYPSETIMNAEERERMGRIIRRWEHQRIASATVILATGLTGALHRSILTGLQFIAPSPHPVKVCGTIRDAVAWLSPKLQTIDAEATPPTMQHAVEDLCARFQANRKALTS